MLSQSYRDCPECGQNRPFEQPHPADCPDSPDGQCPEWACAECGTALIVPLLVSAALVRAAAPPARQPARAA
jgi:hypothetical protein